MWGLGFAWGTEDAVKRRNSPFDPDLAEGSLEVVALAFGSVPSYEGCWDQIHPEDQAEWLASFESVRAHLAQLASWRGAGLLDDDQRARYEHLARQQEVIESALMRLSVTVPGPSAAQARVQAIESLILDD